MEHDDGLGITIQSVWDSLEHSLRGMRSGLDYPISPEEFWSGGDFSIIGESGDIEENSHRHEEREEWGSPITHEGEGDPGQWYDVEIYSDIDECLGQEEGSDSRGCVFGEEIFTRECYPEATIGDEYVERDQNENTQESQFLGDHREDKVSLHLGQVSEFLDGFPESETEKSTRSDSDESLFSLEVDTLVLDGWFIVWEEVVDSVGDIGEFSFTLSWGMLSESIDR